MIILQSVWSVSGRLWLAIAISMRAARPQPFDMSVGVKDKRD
jgi:hypothetical protein